MDKSIFGKKQNEGNEHENIRKIHFRTFLSVFEF
jgi:hypothetical protein